jgi:hypothetical protein
MERKVKRRILALTLALVCSPALARAHYLWIESESDSEARIYFGEFNEGVRERAGGRLDERERLTGRVVDARGAHALALQKRTDHFAARLAGGTGWILADDLAGEVKDWRANDLGIVKPMFYARAAAANRVGPATPALALDILPVAEAPQSFQVFLRGRPLAGAKLFVYAPNLWMQELRADEQGRVAIATPWTGRYVLDVIHLERQPGEFQGRAYEAVRHRATYSFVR